MQSYAFAINDRPQRVWDWDLGKKNLDFLRGVDPDYFAHVARVNAALLAEGKDHHAAMAIRLGYSHALETFMAFASAAFQAPACPLGWMLRYSNDDLRGVIRKVTSGHLALARLAGPPTWDNLATTMVDGLTTAAEQKATIAASFAGLWRRFAHDFLEPAQETEYNSVKHGLRVAAARARSPRRRSRWRVRSWPTARARSARSARRSTSRARRSTATCRRTLSASLIAAADVLPTGSATRAGACAMTQRSRASSPARGAGSNAEHT